MDKTIYQRRTLDDNAADTIPIRFILSIAIIAAVLVLAVLAAENLQVSLAEHQIEDECRKLQSALSTMIASGVARDVDAGEVAAGTMRIQTITLPDSLLFLSFGGSPGLGGRDTVPTEDGAVISYTVQGGSTHFIWFPKEIYKFRKGSLRNTTWVLNETVGDFTICRSGSTTLVFELVQKNHVNYILVYKKE